MEKIRPYILHILIGISLGFLAFTYFYGKVPSYITDNPAACANCHVMNDVYNGWLKSPHRNVAACNDRHTPNNFVGKYFTKALNGYKHSLAFTFGNFPDVIQIHPRNLKIAEQSCLKCHQQIWEASSLPEHASKELQCIKCHQGVGHPN